jgi:hypothetical protein
MSVVNVVIGNDYYTVVGAKEKAIIGGQEGECIKVLAAIAELCNDASFEDENDGQPAEIRKVNGDATGMFVWN